MFTRPLVALCLLISMTTASAADPATDVADELKGKLASAEAALAKDADDLRALQDRGDAYFFLGRFDEAVRDYDRMLELEPRVGPKHWQRGLALYYADRHEDAAKQFERYYELDKSDRENGIWRFYAQVKQNGVDKARKQLLPYSQPDREPLPLVYQLCEGKATPGQVLQSADEPGLAEAEKQKRQFYAELYVGLDALIVRDDAKAARPHLERAMKNPWPRNAGYGPNFMWHIARLSLEP